MSRDMDLVTGLLVISGLLIGISKGGVPAAGAAAVPIMALVMNPLEAAALLLPVFLVTDWLAVIAFRRDVSVPNIKILLPSVLLGIGVAAVVAPYLPEEALLIFTGLIGLWYCLRRVFGASAAPTTLAARGPGIFWGILTGVSTFITHSGAPPIQAYLLPQRLPKLTFAGTIALTFAVGNIAKVPAYASAGLLSMPDIRQIGMLCLVGFAGVWLGRRIVITLPEASYRILLEIMLFALSVMLIARGTGVLS